MRFALPAPEDLQRQGVGCLNNRYHDPITGQFISVDPLVASTGEPYIYAGGNPATYSDPSGLCPPNADCYEDALKAPNAPSGPAAGRESQAGLSSLAPGDPPVPLASGPRCSQPRPFLCDHSAPWFPTGPSGLDVIAGRSEVFQLLVEPLSKGRATETTSPVWSLPISWRGFTMMGGRYSTTTSFSHAKVYVVHSSARTGSHAVAAWQGEVLVTTEGTYTTLLGEVPGLSDDPTSASTFPIQSERTPSPGARVSLGRGAGIALPVTTSISLDSLPFGSVGEGVMVFGVLR